MNPVAKERARRPAGRLEPPGSGIKVVAHPFVKQGGLHGSMCGPAPDRRLWRELRRGVEAVLIGRSPDAYRDGWKKAMGVGLDPNPAEDDRIRNWQRGMGKIDDGGKRSYLPSLVAIVTIEWQPVRDRASREKVLRPVWMIRNATPSGSALDLEMRPGTGGRDRTVLHAGMAATVHPGVYEVLVKGAVKGVEDGNVKKIKWRQVFSLELPPPATLPRPLHAPSGTITTDHAGDGVAVNAWRAPTLLQAVAVACAYAGAIARDDDVRKDGLAEDRIDALGVRDLAPNEEKGVWGNLKTVADAMNRLEQVADEEVKALNARLGRPATREEFIEEFDVEPCLARESPTMFERLRDRGSITAVRSGGGWEIRVALQPRGRKDVRRDGRFHATDDNMLSVWLPDSTIGL